jgi:hypothetical protein
VTLSVVVWRIHFSEDDLARIQVSATILIALAYATNKAAYASAAPVATIVRDVLGGVVQKIFLVFVCVSIFACGGARVRARARHPARSGDMSFRSWPER